MLSSPLFQIELRACEPSRNHWRFYRIEAGWDLFGDLVVRVHYGRIGSRGQTKTHVVPDTAAGVQLVRTCLQRRQSAPKRLGVAYEVLEQFDPDGWLSHRSQNPP